MGFINQLKGFINKPNKIKLNDLDDDVKQKALYLLPIIKVLASRTRSIMRQINESENNGYTANPLTKVMYNKLITRLNKHIQELLDINVPQYIIDQVLNDDNN